MLRHALKGSAASKQKIYTSVLQNLPRRNVHNGQTPAPLEAGVGKYLVLLTPIAVGAGAVAYAKENKAFRQTLVDNIPGIEPVLKVLLQEEGNALQEVSKSVSNTTQKVVDVKDTVFGFFGGSKEEEKTVPSKLRERSVSQPPSVPAASSPTPTAKSTQPSSAAPPLPTLTAPSPQKSSTESQKHAPTPVAAPIASATPAKPVQPKPSADVKVSPVKPQPLPSTLTDLQKSLDEAAQTAVREYNNAIQTLHRYSEDVKHVVDRIIESPDNSIWATLKNKTSARDTAVESAEKAAQEARATIAKLESHVGHVAKDVAPDVLENIKHNIKLVSDQLNKTKDALYDAKDAAGLNEKYWKKVEEARNYFVDQVESLFPGVDLTAKKLNLSKEDIDLFILHAYSHVLAYQKELQKIHVEGETRLKRALEALKGDDQNEAVKTQLEYQLEKEKQVLSLENQKKLFRIQAESEAKLRKQLKYQAEAHADHLADAVTEKEKELRRIFNRELNEKLSVEQAAYKLQLATIIGKLKGMDTALKARADADRQIHQSQALWSACSALWASIRAGDPQQPWHKRLQPLKNEVAAVQRASQGDDLVKIILESLPAEAKSRGVYPEDALRERFLKVEKLARRLALVPAEGATLPKYLLSFAQAALVLQPSQPVTEAELNNEPFDFSQLNTFEILNRTRYYVDRGNMVQALKYANLLRGASRNVASDWINETRLLLETQQAANVLMAHAATSGLSFL